MSIDLISLRMAAATVPSTITTRIEWRTQPVDVGSMTAFGRLLSFQFSISNDFDFRFTPESGR